MRAIEEKQMKIRNVLLVGVLGLSLSGCQSTIGTMAGGLAGAGAGGYAGSMVGSGLGNTIATVGGALGGAVVGGFLGNSLTKPYENSDRIDQTMTAVGSKWSADRSYGRSSHRYG
jgi:uncharacterized protein YcfJ